MGLPGPRRRTCPLRWGGSPLPGVDSGHVPSGSLTTRPPKSEPSDHLGAPLPPGVNGNPGSPLGPPPSPPPACRAPRPHPHPHPHPAQPICWARSPQKAGCPAGGLGGRVSHRRGTSRDATGAVRCLPHFLFTDDLGGDGPRYPPAETGLGFPQKPGFSHTVPEATARPHVPGPVQRHRRVVLSRAQSRPAPSSFPRRRNHNVQTPAPSPRREESAP